MERSEPPESARALTWAMILDGLGEPGHAAPYALRAMEAEPSETAASLAVRVLAKAGRFDEAAAVADRFAWPKPSQQEAARGEIAFARGDWEAAARHYAQAFDKGSAPGDAYNAACSWARAGDRAQALAWVERALKAGFADLQQLQTDDDLAILRGSPELERLLGSVPRA
jgi:tetratricopeptide (TPR) repeat protein